MDRSISTTMNISVILAILVLSGPVLLGQMDTTATDIPMTRPAQTQEVISKYPPERIRANRIFHELYLTKPSLSTQDSLDQIALKKKQAAVRAQMDILGMQLVWISEKLQDPFKMIALAKRLNTAPESQPSDSTPLDVAVQDSNFTVSARAIDLAAVKLIRDKGLSLDQARLHVIERLTSKQVSQYYNELSREDRYALYDIIDTAAQTEELAFDIARKSAIFLHLYAL